LSPYAAVFFSVGLLLTLTGEAAPASWVARLQSIGSPFIYLPAYSDHNYQLKLQAARSIRPEILIAGGSRVNQFRRGMFLPSSFYNACQVLYGQKDYRRFLQDLGDDLPRVLIFSLDFYTFNPDYGRLFEHVAYDDLKWDSREMALILKSMIKNPPPLRLLLPPRDPLYGVPAIGLQSVRTGNGFRIDGSYQYGAAFRGYPNAGTVAPLDGVKRVLDGIPPFYPADRLHNELVAELRRFAEYTRSKGVVLIAITTPMAPEVVEALDKSDRHGAWHQFNGADFANQVRDMGITHFNFVRIGSFQGKANEFVDAFHASEPAYIRMLLRVLDSPALKGLNLNVDRASLVRQLETASPLEAYRNQR
jgi:hypothetical protein